MQIMSAQSNQSADAVNQCGKDPVALALEALKANHEHHIQYEEEGDEYSDSAFCEKNVEAIAALSTIKDQQAQPAEPDQAQRGEQR